MGYQQALEAAGATVHYIKFFGSYQGDWWAKVTYNGKTGWVNGSYGSCTYCDAYQAEFDQYERYDENDREIPLPEDKLAAFGRHYLETMMTQEQAEKIAGQYADDSMEDREMLEWIKANSTTKESIDIDPVEKLQHLYENMLFERDINNRKKMKSKDSSKKCSKKT